MGPEPAMPTMVDVESDLAPWWESLKKVEGLVKKRNAEAHVDFGRGNANRRRGVVEETKQCIARRIRQMKMGMC